ncbi:MAG TPA: hypothetical protein VN249_01050, partial [Prolixibacteraceae bacterium]|nr:hypothetical protein [Prolixibacteraceae bacterium]
MHQFLVIDQPSHLDTYSRELDIFFQLYAINFPDPDEREDPGIICNRIRMSGKGAYAPETTILLSILDDKISGGAILEFYTQSSCFLLTYILVDEHFRGKNIARSLVESGIKMVIDSRKEEVRAIFFESNIPWKTDKSRDSFDAWDRYGVFTKLGAKWIDIAYTQPSLGEGKSKVHNLHFFVFPALTHLPDKIEVSVLTAFLHIFYQELGIQAPESDPDYQKMHHSILESSSGGYIFLSEIPHHEQNEFRFRDVSVAYHFDQEPDENIGGLQTGDSSFCPVFQSYESDLFKYRYQNNPPYRTFYLSQFQRLKCQVIFPEITSYLTEGRHERMKSRDSGIFVDVKLNFTRFSNNRKIWTVVMTPPEGDLLSQDQVIKFISLFSKSQEQNNIGTDTRFICNGHQYGSLEAMVKGITNVQTLVLLQSGIVQTDFHSSENTISGPEIWNEAINAISQISKNQVSAYQQLEKRYREEKPVEQV